VKKVGFHHASQDLEQNSSKFWYVVNLI